MNMKKGIIFVFTLLYVNLADAQTQISIPETPKKIEFANILVELNPEAQRLVANEVNNLLTPQNKFLEQKLERMQWYFPIIERILEEEDIPEDFKYLSVMESSLLPEAISSSNAVGYWQFKENTGREVGLKIDNNQDERKNIHLSTKAAASYIKRNNIIFKNWISCILSYNLGVDGASKIIPVDWSFASEVKFDGNTHPYLIKALANRIAYEHRLNRLKDSPKKFIEYRTKGKSLAEIAVELTVDINELRKYNPWLYAPSIPEDKDYNILIISKLEEVDEISEKIKKRSDSKTADFGFPQLKRITMVSTSPDAPIIYEINGKKGILSQPGDEVAQMASKAKVKIGSFLKYNDMTDKDVAKEGNVYYLQTKNKKAKVPFHTLRKNQNLWEVSQMYGVRLKYLLKYNRLKSSDPVQSGRVIWMQKTRPKNQAVEIIKDKVEDSSKLPVKEDYTKKPVEVTQNNIPPVQTPIEEVKDVPVKPETKIEQPSKPNVVLAETNTPKKEKDLDVNDPIFESKKPTIEPTKKPIENANPKSDLKHTVKQSETLFSISKKYGLTVDQLRRMNNMSPTETLKTNQVLVISKSSTTTPNSLETKDIEEKPKKEPVISKETKSDKPSKTAGSGTHTVTTGETLFSISKRYGVSVNDIRKWNNISDNSISIGQKLIVASDRSTSYQNEPRKSNTNLQNQYHKVAPGETLFSISKKYGVAVNDLKNWNSLSDNNIKVGENLIIKK
jgi:membrane-bound lytic murein transglycosylase D